MATEEQLVSFDEPLNAIELPFGDSTALFYITNTTLNLMYDDIYHSLLFNVSDYAALKFNDDGDEYVILYVLSNNVISRYYFRITKYGYELVHDIDITSDATSLDIHRVTDTRHSISYIDGTGTVGYIAFDQDVGVEYFWDYEDDRISNQIEVDTGDNIGMYFVEEGNVNIEEVGFRDAYITLTPVTGINITTVLTVDITNAIIDVDNITILINDIALTPDQYTIDGYEITFRPWNRIPGSTNSLEVTDGTFTYGVDFYTSPEAKRKIGSISGGYTKSKTYIDPTGRAPGVMTSLNDNS